MKKNIIFDLDGTLIDSIGIWNEVDKKIIESYTNKCIDIYTIQTERELVLRKAFDTDTYLKYCKYLIDKYNIKATPKECIVFEDSISGIKAANEAGLDTVLVYDKYSSKELTETQLFYKYTINNYNELFLNI